jgi:hypothetical protein
VRRVKSFSSAAESKIRHSIKFRAKPKIVSKLALFMTTPVSKTNYPIAHKEPKALGQIEYLFSNFDFLILVLTLRSTGYCDLRVVFSAAEKFFR